MVPEAPPLPEPSTGTVAELSADTVAAALRDVQARISQALECAGRPAGSTKLVAVSKTHPVGAVEAALRAGQTLFGENRVQEAAQKFPALRESWPAMRLHLIGPLQTNKARDAVRVADVIETLDRPRLADAIADAAQREGRTGSSSAAWSGSVMRWRA